MKKPRSVDRGFLLNAMFVAGVARLRAAESGVPNCFEIVALFTTRRVSEELAAPRLRVLKLRKYKHEA